MKLKFILFFIYLFLYFGQDCDLYFVQNTIYMYLFIWYVLIC